jgi:hypothetical protein
MNVVFPTFKPMPAAANGRVGKVTASRLADVVARTKAGYSASRGNYLAQLVAERLTGRQLDGYLSPAMQWGVEMEGEARAAYAFFANVEVEPASFCLHPTIEMAGATPDGLIAPDGLVELKCPTTVTHLETVMTGRIPDRYQVQMQWQLAWHRTTLV